MLISEKIKILYAKHKGRYGIDRMTHALFNDFMHYLMISSYK